MKKNGQMKHHLKIMRKTLRKDGIGRDLDTH